MLKNLVTSIRNATSTAHATTVLVLKGIALAVLTALIGVVMFFGVTFMLMVIGFAIAVLIIAYALNVKFTVSQNGEKIGTWSRKAGFVRTQRI